MGRWFTWWVSRVTFPSSPFVFTSTDSISAARHRAGKEASESWFLAMDRMMLVKYVVVLKDRSLDGFLHVALIHLQVCSFLVCGRALVILDGLQLRPLAPPASVCPHWHPPPASVHTAGLPLLLCLKPAISHHLQNIAVTSTELPAESRSVVVVATCRKSSHGRPVFQPALNLRCESSPAFPPCILSLCTTMVLSAWDVTGPLRTAREPRGLAG
jgi:hypothetical protein